MGIVSKHALLLRAEWNKDGYFSDVPCVQVDYGEGKSFYKEEFESQSFEHHHPIVHSWQLSRKLAGFTVVDKESPQPITICRIINDD